MLTLTRVFQISRPRFWIYLVGPFLLGTIAGTPDNGPLLGISTLFWLLGFSLPFNLFIYGLNDVADYETDRRNPKKQGYEQQLLPKDQRVLTYLTLGLILPWVLAAFQLDPASLILLSIFLLLGAGYSLPPLRFKARPFLDSVSNVLYALPGLFAYTLTSGGALPSVLVVMASTAWCAAMHAYSAVPDSTADRDAGLSTIATVLGKNGTTILCGLLWTLATLLAYPVVGPAVLALLPIYLVMCAGYVKSTSHGQLMRWYAVFPLVNTATGALLTVGLLWVRL